MKKFSIIFSMLKPEIEQVEKTNVTHIESSKLEADESSNSIINKQETNIDDVSVNVEVLELPESLKGLSEEELAKLEAHTKRIADIRLLPTLVVLYILNYLDRNNIASARLGGLEKDLGLVGNQYQTCISILFVGYILMQIPANMFLNKFGRPSIFISTIMCLWGIISTCCGAVQSYAGLVVIRLLLGVVEAGFFGSCLYTLSCWYTRKELSLRNSILYSGSLLSGAFSGLIAAGILKTLHWRHLFYIEGGITVALAPIAYFILPDLPHNTKFLSQQEKDVIIWKLKREVGHDSDSENEESYFGAFKLAMSDVKVWLITGCLLWLVAACGITNYFPSIIQTLKFDRMITLVLTAPPYLLAVVCTFLWATHADRTGERFWHVVSPMILALVAFIINVSTLNVGARYFGMCLMIPSLYCAFTTILSWMSNSVPRPPLKRAIALSTMNCISNSASIWNSYLYFTDAAPRYTVAYICNCVFILLAITCAVALRIRLLVLNKRIETGTMKWEKELGKGNDGSNIAPDFRYLI